MDFNSGEGDEVLLAYGLTGYQFSNTSIEDEVQLKEEEPLVEEVLE